MIDCARERVTERAASIQQSARKMTSGQHQQGINNSSSGAATLDRRSRGAGGGKSSPHNSKGVRRSESARVPGVTTGINKAPPRTPQNKNVGMPTKKVGGVKGFK